MKTKILLAQDSQFSISFNYELSAKLNKVSRRQNTKFQNTYLLECEQIIGPLNSWIQELLSYFVFFEYKQTERKTTEWFLTFKFSKDTWSFVMKLKYKISVPMWRLMPNSTEKRTLTQKMQ